MEADELDAVTAMPANPQLEATLTALCGHVETLAKGSIAGLTICGPTRTYIEQALFPSLPRSFSDGITNCPLDPPDFGSCVRAITRGEIINCGDLTADTFFDKHWRNHCLEHGIRAVQSRPVLLRQVTPYGTFVLAFREARKETDWDVALMKFAADAASTAIQNHLDGAPAL
ncbi:MAG: GAF domain-containing protein [Pseudolabrys sp.]